MFRATKPTPFPPSSPRLQECKPNKYLTDIQPIEETSQRSEKQIKKTIKSTQALTFASKDSAPRIPRPESISASPLFRLPRELRDIIHRYVITARKLKTRGKKRSTRYPFAAYLLTCRAIHQEAVMMFYKYRTFTILPPLPYHLPSPIFSHAHHLRLLISTTDTDPISPLLPLISHTHHFPSAHHLHIHLTYPSPLPPPRFLYPPPPCAQKRYNTIHAGTPALVPLLREMDTVVLTSDFGRVGLGGWGGWVEEALRGDWRGTVNRLRGLGGTFWWGEGQGREETKEGGRKARGVGTAGK